MRDDSELPDPNGPPVRSTAFVEGLGTAVSLGLKMCLGGLAAITVVACFPQRTMGALRSQRLKWQERQQEIAAVVAEPQTPAAPPTEPPHD